MLNGQRHSCEPRVLDRMLLLVFPLKKLKDSGGKSRIGTAKFILLFIAQLSFPGHWGHSSGQRRQQLLTSDVLGTVNSGQTVII